MDETHITDETVATSSSSTSLTFRVGLLCKVIYFIIFSVVGSIESYQNIFLVSIGFTVTQAGFTSGLCYIASWIAAPFWGAIADKTGYRKTVFLILCLVLLFTFFPLPLIARELKSSQALLNSSTLINISASNLTFTGPVSARPAGKNFTSGGPESDKLAGQSPIFYYTISAILILGYTSLFTVPNFIDSTSMNVLETLKSNEGYGKQRMFGALGAGVAVLLCGYAVDKFEHPTLSKYMAIYLVLLPYMMIGLPLTLLLFRFTSWEKPSDRNDFETPDDQLLPKEFHNTQELEKVSLSNMQNVSKEETNGNRSSKPKSRLAVLKDILSKSDNLFLMATALSIGTIRAIFFSFFFLFVKDEINDSKAVMGICMLISGTSAFIMFFYTQRVIKWLGGPFIAVAVGVFAWGARYLLTSFMTNKWLVALPQLLQSFSIALYQTAMIQHMHETSSKEVYMTMFTIFLSLGYGAAGFLANVIGGAIYKLYGGRVLFRGCAIFAFCWLILTFIYHYRSIICKKGCTSKSSKKDTETNNGN